MLAVAYQHGVDGCLRFRYTIKVTMARRRYSAMHDDNDGSSSRQKDRLTSGMKNDLSSTSSIPTTSNLSFQHQIYNDVLEFEDSELGPMNNTLAPSPSMHDSHEMEIVGDTNSSFQFDHEQDEASLAKLEFGVYLPESPVPTTKASLEAHTPGTVSTTDSSEDLVPMDEDEMISGQQDNGQKDADSASDSLRTPPRANRKVSLEGIFGNGKVRDSASTVSTNKVQKEGWLVLQLVRDTLSSVVQNATAPDTTQEAHLENQKELKTMSENDVVQQKSPTGGSRQAFLCSPTSFMIDDDDDFDYHDSEYVSLSQQLPKRRRKRRRRKFRKRGTKSPFLKSLESILGDLIEVPEMICSCAVEAVEEQEPESNPFNQSLRNFALNA